MSFGYDSSPWCSCCWEVKEEIKEVECPFCYIISMDMGCGECPNCHALYEDEEE